MSKSKLTKKMKIKCILLIDNLTIFTAPNHKKEITFSVQPIVMYGNNAICLNDKGEPDFLSVNKFSCSNVTFADFEHLSNYQVEIEASFKNDLYVVSSIKVIK